MTIAATVPRDAALTDADRLALKRMHAVEPVWRGIALARDVIAFDSRVILHAGPPVERDRLSAPLRNSAVAAILYEGWAMDDESARQMIRDGAVRLAPAQDHSAMVPLAAVLSPNMAVQVVCDRNDLSNVAYSPINGGSPFAARFGLGGDKALSHLRWINGNLASTLAIIADIDIPLLPIADAAIAEGDDCHGKTSKATARVVDALAARLGSDTLERRFLDAAPGFFLALWMAAAKCFARRGEGPGSSIVTAFGGNGIRAGLQIGAQPGRWFTAPATPPAGVLDAGFGEQDRLGAIGDSALVDALGFGAMLSLPEGEAKQLLPLIHPAFQQHAVRFGLPARSVVDTGITPRVVLGILERTGRHGRIGGGIYQPPLEPFANAVSQSLPPDSK